MTTLSTTRADPVAEAQRLAVTAAELAPECERARKLDPRLARAIAEAGLFRLCVPRSLDGLEAHPGVLVRAVEGLPGLLARPAEAPARGAGAAGWCVAIQATSGLLGGYLPAGGAQEVYGDP